MAFISVCYFIVVSLRHEQEMFLALLPGVALSRRVPPGCLVHSAAVSVSSSLRQEVCVRRAPACVYCHGFLLGVKMILGRVRCDYSAAWRVFF